MAHTNKKIKFRFEDAFCLIQQQIKIISYFNLCINRICLGKRAVSHFDWYCKYWIRIQGVRLIDKTIADFMIPFFMLHVICWQWFFFVLRTRVYTCCAADRTIRCVIFAQSQNNIHGDFFFSFLHFIFLRFHFKIK